MPAQIPSLIPVLTSAFTRAASITILAAGMAVMPATQGAAQSAAPQYFGPYLSDSAQESDTTINNPVPDHIKNNLSHRDVLARQQAIKDLLSMARRVDGAQALALLAPLAQDPQYVVRASMANAQLFMLVHDDEQNASAALRIVETLSRDSNPYVRRDTPESAVDIIHSFPALSDQTLAILLPLAKDAVSTVRYNTVYALGNLHNRHGKHKDVILDTIMTATEDAADDVVFGALTMLTQMVLHDSTLIPVIADRIMVMANDPAISAFKHYRLTGFMAFLALQDTSYDAPLLDMFEKVFAQGDLDIKLEALNRLWQTPPRNGTELARAVAIAENVWQGSTGELRASAGHALIIMTAHDAAYEQLAMRLAPDAFTTDEYHYFNIAIQKMAQITANNGPNAPAALQILLDHINSKNDTIQKDITSYLSLVVQNTNAHDSAIIPHFLRLASAPQTGPVKREALAALFLIMPRLSAADSAAAMDQAAQTLAANDVWGRTAFLDVLGRAARINHAHAAAFEALVRPQINGTADPVRRAAIETLGKFAGYWPDRRDDLLAMLRAINPQDNQQTIIGLINAYQSIGSSDKDGAIATYPLLLPHLKNSDVDVLAGTITAIGMMARTYEELTQPAITALTPLLKSSDSYIEYTARTTIQTLRDALRLRVDVQQTLIRSRLENDLPHLQADSAAAEAALPEIEALAAASEPTSRRIAAAMAGNIARAHPALAATAAQTIFPLLKDSDSGVRMAALQNAGMIALQDAALAEKLLPLLPALAADADVMLAGLAVNAAGMIGSRHPALADMARMALEQIQQQTPHTMLRGNADGHLQKIKAPQP